MICPNCAETLRERERYGIEIDVCPVCRGIWLDRGELDKLMDRETRYYDEDDWGRRQYTREGGRVEYGEGNPREREYRDRACRDRPQQKKKGFFQNLMETFGEGGEGGMDD